MNAFYRANVDDLEEICTGVVVGEDESELMERVIRYYGWNHISKITFEFGKNSLENVIEIADLKNSSLFDLK